MFPRENPMLPSVLHLIQLKRMFEHVCTAAHWIPVFA